MFFSVHDPLKRLPFLEIHSLYATKEEIIIEALDRSLGTEKVYKNEDYGYDKNDRTIHDSITITPLGNDKYNLKFTDVKLSYLVSFASRLGAFQARENKASYEKEREEAWAFMPPEPENFTWSEDIHFYLYHEYEDVVSDVISMYNIYFLTGFFMYQYKYEIEGCAYISVRAYRPIDLFYLCYLLGWTEYTYSQYSWIHTKKRRRERLVRQTQEHKEKVAEYEKQLKKGLLRAKDLPKLEYLQKILNTNTVAELQALREELEDLVNILSETRDYLLLELDMKVASLEAFD